MVKFIGKFEDLEKLDFTSNIDKTYYFLQKADSGHTIFIDVITREIEYAYPDDLKILDKLYIVEDDFSSR